MKSSNVVDHAVQPHVHLVLSFDLYRLLIIVRNTYQIYPKLITITLTIKYYKVTLLSRVLIYVTSANA